MFRAPFPYFGGKSAIASEVWSLLGQPKHYLEPFFGSGAVLLARPHYDPTQYVETVCDKDGFLANVWRALQFAPDEVAKWCDWPVNHADLMARKAALLKNESRLLEQLVKDDRWHDPVMAGYWVWAASCWIGTGLTSPGQISHISHGGKGVHAIGQIPHLSDGGMGVHVLGKRPHLSSRGMGVHALGKRPHLSGAWGMPSVHKTSLISNEIEAGQGVQEPYNMNLYTWFRQLSDRLRHVRVVCGDWTRICGGNWQANMGTVGIFFDPPYAISDRDQTIYHQESATVALDVQRWCLERGANPAYRIVLASYDEHEPMLVHGWTKQAWKARGGYGNLGSGQGRINRHREVLYVSPHCLRQKLFAHWPQPESQP